MDKSIIIILGKPGSGKGTQAELVEKNKGYVHLNMGGLLRHHIENNTELGVQIKDILAKGNFVPDEMSSALALEFLDKHSKNILDGWPRTVGQAKILQEYLSKNSLSLDAVFYLDVSDDACTQRLIKRGKSSGRADDNSDVIKHRFDVYYKSAHPLTEFYAEILLSIDGERSIQEVYQDILTNLEQM